MIGKKISEARKSKGLTQEGLAEKLKVKLRTIQRIERSESIPRGSTLNLICDALEIKPDDLKSDPVAADKKPMPEILINLTFLIPLNIALMMVPGYLTLDSEANLNSRIGALLLSFFIPFFVVAKTPLMRGLERMLKFGTGYLVYMLIGLMKFNFIIAFSTLFLPALLVSLAVLYYGRLKP